MRRTKALALKVYLLFTLLTTGSEGFAQNLRIDHVIYALPDLGLVSQNFEDQGFVIKQGTLHANGLLNAHIKFRNDCGLELMTLVKEPGDELARHYALLMKDGPVGAYLAFTGMEEESIIGRLEEAGLSYQLTTGRLWSYITFSSDSPLAHLFFIVYHTELSTARRFTEQGNGYEYLQEVVIEGGDEVIRFFQVFGLGEPRRVKDTKFGNASRFSTAIAGITVVSPREPTRRPRVLEVTVQNMSKTESLTIPLK